MNGVQCDNCRQFSVSPDGWLILVRQAARISPLSVLTGETSNELQGTFCRLLCLLEWAYTVAAVTEAATGRQMPPRAGLGWPRGAERKEQR